MDLLEVTPSETEGFSMFLLMLLSPYSATPTLSELLYPDATTTTIIHEICLPMLSSLSTL